MLLRSRDGAFARVIALPLAHITSLSLPSDVEAISHAGAIAQVEGLDALFVERIDLTVFLGAGSPDDPAVLEAVRHVVAAGKSAGRAIGMFVPRTEDVGYWREQGASFSLQGSDHAMSDGFEEGTDRWSHERRVALEAATQSIRRVPDTRSNVSPVTATDRRRA